MKRIKNSISVNSASKYSKITQDVLLTLENRSIFFQIFCSGLVAKLRISAKFRSIKEKLRSRKPLGRIFFNLSSDAI